MSKSESSPTTTNGAERPRLGALFGRLDEILRELDREDAELEDQLALYREACAHLGSARAILEETRAEIEFLLDGDSTEPAGGERTAGTDQ